MVREPVLKPDFSDVRGRRLLIALSGGADSVALAVMLAGARTECGLTLFAAHIDHGIRPESAADADFCRQLCARLDIPFHTVRLDVPAASAQSREGLETAARRLRYGQLFRLQRQTRSDYIALAHHMDDQAETVLMHLFRGAGLDGLCGMRRMQPGSPLYRPLLGYRKEELTAYLRERGIGWREDATNRVPDNPRNALRLNAIPELERWYPGLVHAVARCADTAQIEGDLVESLTRDYLTKSGNDNPLCPWLDVSALPHRAVLRRAIRALCPQTLNWQQIGAVEALCGQRRGKTDLGLEWSAERTGNRLYFAPKRFQAPAPAALTLYGETVLEQIATISASPCAPVPVRDNPYRQVLNAAALRWAVLRTRREGDHIRPLGGGDKLLSDYLIDKKVDRPLRDFIPLVAVGRRVHWVCGFGISQEAAVSPGDDAVMLECRKTLYGG